jgi:hypothetical protein
MTDRYRKKPVEVRAWKIGLDGREPDWVREAFDGGRIDWCPAGEGVYINTLEGRMKANIGDMLIEGVNGELYGCRADIFAATYEPVETTLATQAEAEPRLFLTGEDDAWCAECGVKLENVRPGKHQHPTCSQAALQQPAAETVNVIGMPEFDGLLDHIYEHGTAAEGVIEKANAFARAVIARYAPQQPAAVS